MTAFYLCLILPCLPLLSIAADLHDDRVSDLEIARLTADLPPARPLNPDDWPIALSPLDLPGIGHTEELAAVELAPRVFVPAPAPLVVGLAVVEGRHHVGVAPGTEQQRARWDSPTGQFWQIVEGLGDLSQPCSHCATPEDGERPHAGCPGCACPCSLVEVPA